MEPLEPVEEVTIAATDSAGHDAKVRRVELVISNLLRAGVMLSVVVILGGMGLTFVHHPEYRTSHEPLARLTRPGATEFPTTIAEVLRGLARFEGRAVVVLGVLLLVVTPIVRVGASVLAFWYERDWRFVWITVGVLVMLVVSFLVGGVE